MNSYYLLKYAIPTMSFLVLVVLLALIVSKLASALRNILEEQSE